MRNLSLLLLCLLLQACTQTQRGLGDTLKLAFQGEDDIQLTNHQIENIPYASMYLSLNNERQIFVVLGYNEAGQQKWITQDRAVIVMQDGRLVKTLGLTDNLNEVSNLQQDPLRQPLRLTTGASWTRTLSWTEQGQLRSATAVSHFTRLADEVLDLAGHHVACQVWQEDVQLNENGKSWSNTFWVDASNGQIRRAEQMLGADYFPVTTTILKPATP